METVVAIIVTFNRLNDLKKCVDSLRKQSYPINQILVFDNSSSDGTSDWLTLQHDVISLLNESNIGGAGGFHAALQEGYKMNFNWFWIMDDDCCPAENCLELLMTVPDKEKYAALAPTVYEQGTIPASHRGNLVYQPNLANLQVPIAPSDTCAISPIDYASFVGLLVPYQSVTKVGFPRPDFFIHHDDVEYSMRLGKQVGKIALLHEARIDHLQAAKKATNTSAAKKGVAIDKLWIQYYGIRNNIWLKRTYWPELVLTQRIQLTLSFTKGLLTRLAHTLVYDDWKLKRLQFYYHAYKDGWNGTFDNQKPKKILALKKSKS
jgi:rhamnopyranosyl-N-acetylglucosaminyl-diphospho-decaprenol beta-1,3/1,4-galactofuranosyltransferase